MTLLTLVQSLMQAGGPLEARLVKDYLMVLIALQGQLFRLNFGRCNDWVFLNLNLGLMIIFCPILRSIMIICLGV